MEPGGLAGVLINLTGISAGSVSLWAAGDGAEVHGSDAATAFYSQEHFTSEGAFYGHSVALCPMEAGHFLRGQMCLKSPCHMAQTPEAFVPSESRLPCVSLLPHFWCVPSS